MNLPATVSAEAAQLPAVYESAKQALATCERVDECQDWADKAAALASYARQAEDQSLMNHAMRIQARAARRVGELLERIEPGKNRFDRTEGDHPSNRKEAAQAAGLSEHQQKQAVRVARVPPREFERQVESDSPPTVSKLAQLGTRKNPEHVRRAANAWQTLAQFSAWTKDNPASEIAAGFMEHEINPAIEQADCIEAWLRNLRKHLCTQQ